MSFVLLKLKTVNNKISALHIQEEGLIMKLLRKMFVNSISIFVEKFIFSHTTLDF